MIKNSFIFLPQISENKEKKMWSEGIKTWDKFLDSKEIKGISKSKKIYYDTLLKLANQNLNNEKYFSKLLKPKEHYRLYDIFKDECCFLDIETSNYYGDITVIGIYDGKDTKTMVKGFNLDKELLKKELQKYKMIITFNGSSFDLPVIKKYFGADVIPSEILHVDLRYVCAKIGLNGGLKKIEKEINLHRRRETELLSGEDAVVLWRNFQKTGDRKYLDLLIQYNEEDIVNLKPIADYAISELKNVQNSFLRI